MKKNVKFLVISASFLMGDFVAMAQKLDPLSKVGLQNVESASTNDLVLTLFDERYEGLKGTFYLIPHWLDADLYDNEGQILRKDVPVKYDAVNKELVMKKPNGDSVAVYPSNFTIYDKKHDATYHFVKYPQNKSKNGVELPKDYLMVLHQGENMLLKHVSKEMVKADFKGVYNSINRTYDGFEDNSTYFFIKKDGQINKIKLQKEQILNILKDKKQVLRAYIKANELDLKNEKDLVKVFAFYDAKK